MSSSWKYRIGLVLHHIVKYKYLSMNMFFLDGDINIVLLL